MVMPIDAFTRAVDRVSQIEQVRVQQAQFEQNRLDQQQATQIAAQAETQRLAAERATDEIRARQAQQDVAENQQIQTQVETQDQLDTRLEAQDVQNQQRLDALDQQQVLSQQINDLNEEPVENETNRTEAAEAYRVQTGTLQAQAELDAERAAAERVAAERTQAEQQLQQTRIDRVDLSPSVRPSGLTTP